MINRQRGWSDSVGKRRKRLPDKKQLPQPEEVRSWKLSWYGLFAFSGWIVAALSWTLDLPGKVDDFYKHKDQAWRHVAPAIVNPTTYEGRWTNSPSLRPDENLISDGSQPIDDGTVQLDLQRDAQGNFSGEIETSLMSGSLVPWSRVMVEGHIQPLGGFDGEAWDIVSGRHRTIAYFHLSTSDEMGGHAIQFSADSKFSQFLPSKTVLWRTDAKMSDGKMGAEYEKVLMQAASEKNGTK